MKKYQVIIKNKTFEIIQDDDGKFIIPEYIKEQEQFGTALKPSFEPIIVARKPFKGSLVDNVIEYGVGGINIDECRVGNEHFEIKNGEYDNNENQACFGNIKRTPKKYNGRFPANTILTYDQITFDEVCGGFPNTKSSGLKINNPKFTDTKKSGTNKLNFGLIENAERTGGEYISLKDSGSASRYFYCAKASKKDRDEGLDDFEDKEFHSQLNTKNGGGAIRWRKDTYKKKHTPYGQTNRINAIFN